MSKETTSSRQLEVYLFLKKHRWLTKEIGYDIHHDLPGKSVHAIMKIDEIFCAA
jgi:hypothetical protein